MDMLAKAVLGGIMVISLVGMAFCMYMLLRGLYHNAPWRRRDDRR